MDRLLVIDPKVVVIKFEVGQKSYGIVQLQNVMHTMPVAFKVQGINRKYSFKPPHGIIPPLGAVDVEIILQPQTELPDSYPLSNDRFLIHSIVVPGGKDHETVSSDWFSAKKKQVFTDSGLRAVFVGASILTKLVADGSMEDIREVLEKDAEIVNCSDDQGRTPLHIAVVDGRPDVVQLLLEFRANVEGRDRIGQTAIQTAAAAGDELAVELLLANHASTEAETSSGWRALHFAASGGHVEILRILLQKGAADVNAAANDGRTALHMTAEEGRRDCLKLLLSSGADVDSRSLAEGETALHRAAARGDGSMVRLLLQRGANKEIRDGNGKTAYDLAAEAGNSSLFDLLQLGDGLRRSARRGELRNVEQFLERGASINGKDQNGWTALHRAAFKGWGDIVRVLLEKGADLDSRDDDGYTALHCAAEPGHMEIVQLLLKKGADVNARCNRGVTPLQIARRLQYSGIVRLLEEGDSAKIDPVNSFSNASKLEEANDFSRDAKLERVNCVNATADPRHTDKFLSNLGTIKRKENRRQLQGLRNPSLQYMRTTVT